MGPGFIVMNSAKAAGLSDPQAVSWLLAIYGFGGVATIFVSLRYRIPVVIAYSIPGAVLLGKLLPTLHTLPGGRSLHGCWTGRAYPYGDRPD